MDVYGCALFIYKKHILAASLGGGARALCLDTGLLLTSTDIENGTATPDIRRLPPIYGRRSAYMAVA